MGKPANDIALQILYDQYGEENVEKLEGNMARTPEGVVTLITKTNPRHDIAAELAAMGMRQNEIEMILKRDKTKGSSGYYGRVLKNPLVKARQDEFAREVAEEAKAKLTGCVVKAAENLEAAVQGGHLPSSLQVLKMADVINPVQKSEKSVKVSFGSWLNEGNAKTIPVDPVQEGIKERPEIEEATIVDDDASCASSRQPIAMSADDMSEEPVDGERLTDALFDGDEDG